MRLSDVNEDGNGNVDFNKLFVLRREVILIFKIFADMQSWKEEVSDNLDRYQLTIRKLKNDINIKVGLLEKNKESRDMQRKGLLLR